MIHAPSTSTNYRSYQQILTLVRFSTIIDTGANPRVQFSGKSLSKRRVTAWSPFDSRIWRRINDTHGVAALLFKNVLPRMRIPPRGLGASNARRNGSGTSHSSKWDGGQSQRRNRGWSGKLARRRRT